LTAWLGSSAKPNNRNKQNKLPNHSRRNIALFHSICPLNVLNLSSSENISKKQKSPEKRQKQPNFRGLDFCLIFCCCKFISQQDAMSRIAVRQPACWRVAFLTVSGTVDYPATATKKQKNFHANFSALRSKHSAVYITFIFH